MTSLNRIEYLQSDHVDPVKEQPVKYPPIIQLIRLFFQVWGYLFPRKAAKVAYKLFSTPRVRARHRTSDELLESARVFEFMYGKQLLKGYEWGYGGRTALLVHGWESRGTALRHFVPDLLERGFRVVTFDGPAHGNSGGKRTNLMHFAGAVRAVIKQAGGVHSVITHSFGGASTSFLLSHLDPSMQVQNLVLIGVPDKIEEVLQNAIRTMSVPPPAAKSFVSYIESKVNVPVSTVALSNMQLPNVGKVLIVHDEDDPVVSIKDAKAVLHAWPKAQLLISKGYGHYRLMKNPDITERVADFISTP
jgi:pimeloyl-ACP methyl ester carboxylesterase